MEAIVEAPHAGVERANWNTAKYLAGRRSALDCGGLGLCSWASFHVQSDLKVLYVHVRAKGLGAGEGVADDSRGDLPLGLRPPTNGGANDAQKAATASGAGIRCLRRVMDCQHPGPENGQVRLGIYSGAAVTTMGPSPTTWWSPGILRLMFSSLMRDAATSAAAWVIGHAIALSTAQRLPAVRGMITQTTPPLPRPTPPGTPRTSTSTR